MAPAGTARYSAVCRRSCGVTPTRFASRQAGFDDPGPPAVQPQRLAHRRGEDHVIRALVGASSRQGGDERRRDRERTGSDGPSARTRPSPQDLGHALGDGKPAAADVDPLHSQRRQLPEPEPGERQDADHERSTRSDRPPGRRPAGREEHGFTTHLTRQLDLRRLIAVIRPSAIALSKIIDRTRYTCRIVPGASPWPCSSATHSTTSERATLASRRLPYSPTAARCGPGPRLSRVAFIQST